VPLLAIEGPIYHIAGIAQGSGELTIEIRIVLDNQQTHVCLPRVNRPNCTANSDLPASA